MKAWEIPEFGLENLKLVDRPDPEPGPGQVLLRMRARSLNFRDLLMVRGKYNPKMPLPVVPLSDGVGEVVAVGDGVERAKVGDRVSPIFAQRWIAGTPTKTELRSTLGGPLDGTLRELMVCSEEAIVPVPEHLSDEEGATLPCAALTAWSALVEQGGVAPGDTVLVQGTGGVSIFALQLATMLGARVIATSSSDDKLERAKELGASELINYKSTPEWGKAARALTDGRGVDHVVEVGGAGTLEQSIRATKPGGTISLIGVLAGGAAPVNLTPVLMQNIRIQGVLVGHRQGFENMNRAIAHHQLRPVVDRVFPFAEAREAMEHLASQKHLGKVCIT